MEKTVIEPAQLSAEPQSFSPVVARKPVPTSTDTGTLPKSDLARQDSSPPLQHIEDTTKPQVAAVPPLPKSEKHDKTNAPLPPLPPPVTSTNTITTTPNPRRSSPSLVRRLYTQHYQSRPKRTRILILTALVLVVVLTIVLATAIPLTHRSKFSHLPLPTTHGGPYTGDLTYYEPGLGACGVTSTPSDYIVSISHYVFDAVSRGSDPNQNPLCGLKVRATRGGKSVDLTVVDRCVGCQPDDLDTSVTVFAGLASVDQGRVGVSWAWLQDLPA